jgi:hypothetical protein
MPSDPKGYAGSEDFQTKHLDCGLDTYEIAANGQLSIHKREGNYIEGDKEAKGLFDKIGHYEVTRTWVEPVYDTLTMEMYDYRESSESGYDYFVQYQVVFIDGIVDEIKLTTFEATDNSARKIKDEEFNKKLKEWHDFTKTRKYRYLLRPYSSCVRFIFRKLSNVLRFSQSNLYKVEKFFSIK